jgi:hypothetical protein
VLLYFEDILDHLDVGDPFRRPVEKWVAEQRRAMDPRLRELEKRAARLRRRAARLGRRLGESEATVEALRSSRSWRVTGPLRATSDRLRSLRG